MPRPAEFEQGNTDAHTSYDTSMHHLLSMYSLGLHLCDTASIADQNLFHGMYPHTIPEPQAPGCLPPTVTRSIAPTTIVKQ